MQISIAPLLLSLRLNFLSAVFAVLQLFGNTPGRPFIRLVVCTCSKSLSKLSCYIQALSGRVICRFRSKQGNRFRPQKNYSRKRPILNISEFIDRSVELEFNEITFIGKAIISTPSKTAETRNDCMLKSDVYFSDEEQSGPQEVPASALLQAKGEEDIRISEFEKKIKNFYEELKSAMKSVPIKDVVVIESQNICESQTSSKVCQQAEDQSHQKEHYPKTRSRGQCETFQPIFELEEKPRPARGIAQTKFRHRKLRKIKSPSGPQPDYFRILLQNFGKIEKEEVKTHKVVYFSDDETEAGNELPEYDPAETTFPQKEEEEQGQREDYLSVGQRVEREEAQNGQTKVGNGELDLLLAKFNDQIYKNESSYEGDLKGVLKFENQNLPIFETELQSVGTIIVRKDTMSRLFEDWSLHLQQAKYEAEPGEHPFFQVLYSTVKEELCYRKENERSSHHIMKGRLYVIRRIMQIYSNIVPKKHSEKEKDRFVRNRLTNSDRKFFEKAGLPCPPCRPTTGFLRALFSNTEFALFFSQFVRSAKLNKLLMDKSEKEVRVFSSFYIKVSSRHNNNLDDMMQDIQSKPFPLSHLEVVILKKEAETICEKYCNGNQPWE